MRWERIRRVKVCSLKNWKDGLPLIEVRGGESSFLVFGRLSEFGLGCAKFELLIVHLRQSCQASSWAYGSGVQGKVQSEDLARVSLCQSGMGP